MITPCKILLKLQLGGCKNSLDKLYTLLTHTHIHYKVRLIRVKMCMYHNVDLSVCSIAEQIDDVEILQ